MRHREGLGFGDVKLIAMVGAFLGLRDALAILILGSVAGSILGYGYIKATGRTRRPTNCRSARSWARRPWPSAFAGQRLLGWYSGL